jgi:hypothetical protein
MTMFYDRLRLFLEKSTGCGHRFIEGILICNDPSFEISTSENLSKLVIGPPKCKVRRGRPFLIS